MKLHTVIVSYNRRDLTKQAIESYLETVTVPYRLIIVDNGSEQSTQDWLRSKWVRENSEVLFLGANRYPGFATNRGFELMGDASEATHLHRADNDFKFIPGWCEHVELCFRQEGLGQLGLRTNEEECYAKMNVGGNMIIRRELWEEGLRYDERPWGEYPAGYSEDSFYSPEVVKMGWQWRRVDQPCIESLASGDLNDPYYQESYSKRGILVETIQEIQNRQALGIKEQP